MTNFIFNWCLQKRKGFYEAKPCLDFISLSVFLPFVVFACLCTCIYYIVSQEKKGCSSS